MIKAIIVDDEDIVRLTLMTIIDWHDLGIEIVGTYANGKQVLNHLERSEDVQLLVTDINMPILSGLELMKKLKDHNDSMEFLVISAYDDYELVREAFKLGITDYILKQNISKETLTNVMTKIVGRMDRALISDEENERQKVEKNLYSIIFDPARGDDVEIAETVLREGYVLCLLGVEDYRRVMTHFGSDIQKDFILPFKQIIRQIETSLYRFYLVNKNQNEFVLVVVMTSKEPSVSSINQELKVLLNRMITQLKSYLNVNASISVSDYSNDDRRLKHVYETTKERNRFKYIFGDQSIIYPESLTELEEVARLYLKDFIDPFVSASIEANKVEVMLYMELLKDMMAEAEVVDTFLMSARVYLLIVCEVASYLESVQDDMVNVYGKKMNYYGHLHKFTDVHELDTFMKNWIEWFMDYVSNQSDRLESNVIEKSKKYMMQFCTRHDLTLVEVSNYLGLSDKYFSSLFSKEVGVTYKEYLTNLRIDKAIELMKTTNMKVYEIGNEVGYNNTEHFSRVFKKHIGFSPNDYKKMHSSS